MKWTRSVPGRARGSAGGEKQMRGSEAARRKGQGSSERGGIWRMEDCFPLTEQFEL